jgi:hypothetical protein
MHINLVHRFKACILFAKKRNIVLLVKANQSKPYKFLSILYNITPNRQKANNRPRRPRRAISIPRYLARHGRYQEKPSWFKTPKD